MLCTPDCKWYFPMIFFYYYLLASLAQAEVGTATRWGRYRPGPFLSYNPSIRLVEMNN